MPRFSFLAAILCLTITAPSRADSPEQSIKPAIPLEVKLAELLASYKELADQSKALVTEARSTLLPVQIAAWCCAAAFAAVAFYYLNRSREKG